MPVRISFAVSHCIPSSFADGDVQRGSKLSASCAGGWQAIGLLMHGLADSGWPGCVRGDLSARPKKNPPCGVAAVELVEVSKLRTHRCPMNCTISFSIGKVKMSYQVALFRPDSNARSKLVSSRTHLHYPSQKQWLPGIRGPSSSRIARRRDPGKAKDSTFQGPSSRPRESPSTGFDFESTRSNHGKTCKR